MKIKTVPGSPTMQKMTSDDQIARGQTVVDLDEGELHVRSLPDAVRRAQSIVREFVPADATLSDELIAERRAEAADD